MGVGSWEYLESGIQWIESACEGISTLEAMGFLRTLPPPSSNSRIDARAGIEEKVTGVEAAEVEGGEVVEAWAWGAAEVGRCGKRARCEVELLQCCACIRIGIPK